MHRKIYLFKFLQVYLHSPDLVLPFDTKFIAKKAVIKQALKTSEINYKHLRIICNNFLIISCKNIYFIIDILKLLAVEKSSKGVVVYLLSN